MEGILQASAQATAMGPLRRFASRRSCVSDIKEQTRGTRQSTVQATTMRFPLRSAIRRGRLPGMLFQRNLHLTSDSLSGNKPVMPRREELSQQNVAESDEHTSLNILFTILTLRNLSVELPKNLAPATARLNMMCLARTPRRLI
jgi:hypothetical protein